MELPLIVPKQPLSRLAVRFGSAGSVSLVGGTGCLVLLAIIALAAPVLAPYSPTQTDLLNTLSLPSATHLLGTDQFGRDVLSRLIWGARVSLLVALAVVTISLLAGGLLGVLAGFLPTAGDLAVTFVIDVLLAFPGFLLAIALVAARGPSLENVILAISLAYTPRVAVVMRAVVLTVRSRPFIEAARATGVSTAGIILRHVLPNSLPPVIVVATVSAGTAILAEAGLSYLGVGIQPPAPTWGNVIADGQSVLQTHPWISLAAGLCIAASVISLNLVGDGLRDNLDPQLRGSTSMRF